VRVRGRLLVLLVLLVAGPAGAWEDPSLGLRGPDPPGWEKRALADPTGSLGFYGPPGPGPRPTLELHARPSEGELTPDFVREVVRRLAADLRGFRLLGTRRDRVLGVEAWRLGYRAGLDGHDFRTTQVLWVWRGRLCVLTLNSPPGRHDGLLPVLNRTLEQMEAGEDGGRDA